MGDWLIDENDNWIYDEDAPSPSAGVTALAPRPSFQLPGGSTVYERAEPGWFDSFDEVDSRTITDDGGPPDAA